MASTDTTRNGKGHRAYRRQRRILKRKQLPCTWCGQPIDYTLPYTHPMSYTADHTVALANGGELLQDLQPMHRKCNSAKGVGTVVTLRPND